MHSGLPAALLAADPSSSSPLTSTQQQSGLAYFAEKLRHKAPADPWGQPGRQGVCQWLLCEQTVSMGRGVVQPDQTHCLPLPT